MKCKQAQPNLLEYSRGLLNRRVAEAVGVHLAVCSECRSMLEGEMLLSGKLSALPRPAPASDVWPLVRRKLQYAPRPAEVLTLIFKPYARRLAAGLATVVVALSAGFGVMHWRAAENERATVAQAIELMRVQTTEKPGNVDMGEGTTDAMMKVLQEQVPQGEM